MSDERPPLKGVGALVERAAAFAPEHADSMREIVEAGRRYWLTDAGIRRVDNALIAVWRMADVALAKAQAVKNELELNASNGIARAVAVRGTEDPLLLESVAQRLLRNGDYESVTRALMPAATIGDQKFQRMRLEALSFALTQLGRKAEAAKAHHQLAELNVERSLWAEAYDAEAEALALDPELAAALALQADIVRMQGDRAKFAAALASIEKAIALAPQVPSSYAICGAMLMELGRHQDALVAYERALELAPLEAEWHRHHAEALQHLGRNQDALTSINRAIELDDQQWQSHARRGDVLRRLNRYEEALMDFDRALEITPDVEWVLTTKGDTLRRMGKSKEAEDLLKGIVDRMERPSAFVLTALGHAQLDRNCELEALAKFDRVLAENSGYEWALSGKGEALRRLDRCKDALAVMQALIEVAHDSSWAHGMAGAIHYSRDDYESGLTSFESSVRYDANASWTHSGLSTCAITLVRTGTNRHRSVANCKEIALAASRTAIALAPDDLSVRANLAESLCVCEPGSTDALAELERVLAAARTANLDYYSALDAGCAALRLASRAGEAKNAMLAEAERLTIEAISQNGSLPSSSNTLTARFVLALIMLCGRRYALALREYESAIQASTTHELEVRRGLLRIAKVNLEEAMNEWSNSSTGHYWSRALEELTKASELPAPEVHVAAEIPTEMGLNAG